MNDLVSSNEAVCFRRRRSGMCAESFLTEEMCGLLLGSFYARWLKMSMARGYFWSTEVQPETPEQRVERELADLREREIVEKAPPTISRSTLDRLSLKEQSAFYLAGGQVADDPRPAKKPLPEGAVRRSTFDAMSPGAKMDFIKAGGYPVDDERVMQLPSEDDRAGLGRMRF